MLNIFKNKEERFQDYLVNKHLYAYEIFKLAFNDLSIKDDDQVLFTLDPFLQAYGSTAWNTIEKKVAYIAINQNLDATSMAITIFHECRHLYQGLKDHKLLDGTKNNIDIGYENYRNQPTEMTARAYANWSVQKYEKQIKQLKKEYGLR